LALFEIKVIYASGMMDSIGVDIIEIDRIAKTYHRHGSRFATRILSPGEREILAQRADKSAFLAGRFAAKEAVMKALGEFFESDVHLRDIEIVNDRSGRPFVELPKSLSGRLGAKKILLSISHSKNNAVAVAVIGE
jgi:holo-[acyl-carrier protein] synthase